MTEQLRLDDPVLNSSDAENMRRCAGATVQGRRCARRAPAWYIPIAPWRCHDHGGQR